MKCPHCKKEVEYSNLGKTKIINGIEYCIEDLFKGSELSDIKIPVGWRLWTVEECINLFNNHKKEANLKECWFFIKQPFKFNENEGYGAWFGMDSDRAILFCNLVAQVTNPELGVRFCREVKK